MDKKLLAKLVAGIFGSAPFLSVVSHPALAAGTDIASAPLANRRSSDIKPNIMLILDDSGSMMQDYMPDSAGSNDPYGPGRRSHLCNTIYYNPTPTNTNLPLSPYLVPRTDAGVSLNSADPASFSISGSDHGAYDNGYWSYDQIGQNAGVARRTNLSTDQGYGASYDGGGAFPGRLSARSGQAAYYWKFLPTDATGSNAIKPGSAECILSNIPAYAGNYTSATGICSPSASAPYLGSYYTVTGGTPACTSGHTLIWQKVLVSATSSPSGGDETLRFANWYSYYRSRMQMTKSAIGRAFLPLIGKKKYRAGFITIAPQQLDNGAPQSSVYGYDAAALYNSKFLEIRNFDTTDLATNQPNRWFNILYAQRPNGATPLREGLSRVGRYYAGKGDGPSNGMIPSNAYDPVQYACQQNFSILTTDGYWDSPVGSIGGYKMTYNGTGFSADSDPIGNQDGNINEVDAYGQSLAIGARPIYDGAASSTATTYDAQNAYQNILCDYWLQSTRQILQSTVQPLQTTQRVFGWTRQPLINTTQKLSRTSQELANTRQVFSWQQQPLRQTVQKFRRIQQEWATWVQTQNYDRWVNRNTRQVAASTQQVFGRTDLMRLGTRTRWSNTVLVNRSTTLVRQNTTLIRRSTTQPFVKTEQRFASTTQRLISTTQQKASTSQVFSCLPGYIGCNPTPTCTPTLEQVVCSTTTSGPTAVASCSAGTDTSTWITTTCATTTTGPTGLSSVCTAPPAASPTWITTTCATTTTGPTATSSAACTNATNSSGWITSTCATSTTTFASISSCAASTNTSTWVTTICSNSTTGPTATSSAACVPGTDTSTWITTTCATTTTGPTGVSACNATTDTSTWITSACATTTTGPSPTAATSCTTGVNSWITTFCPTTTTALTLVSSTACAATSSTTTWITTTCATSTIGPSATSSCSAAAASAGNGWVETFCSSTSTAFASTASCTSGINTGTWVTTACSTTTIPTLFVASSCSLSTNTTTWITTTACTTLITGPAPNVSACTPTTAASPNWITTTCSTTTTAVTGVSSCTASTNTSTWVTTVCSVSTATSQFMSSCITAPATSTNFWIATNCFSTDSGFTAISACTPTTAASPTWLTTTCSTSTVPFAPISSCTAPSATSPTWITTTCSTSLVAATAAVSACSPTSSTSTWITTVCSTTNATTVAVASCATVTNTTNWITTTACSTSSTTFAPSASCTASTNTGTWVTTYCSTITATSAAASSCSVSTNSTTWVTTTACSTSIATSAAVAACSPSTDGATWITTVCSTSNTGPTGVSSCAPGTSTDTSTWVTSTCSTSTTTDVPIASCTTGTGGTWVTTTCSTITSATTTVQSCTTVAPSSSTYVATLCALQSDGTKNQYQTQTRSRQDRYSDTVLVGSTPYPAWPGNWSTSTFPTSGFTDMSLCLPPPSGADAWTGWPGNAVLQPLPGDPATPPYTSLDAGCTGWPCVHVDSTATGGSSNSLADVAQYYYKTDLRPAGTTGFNGLNVSSNIVPSSANDPTEGDKANWQHMTTFTMGLGVSGQITYNKGYKDKPAFGSTYMTSPGINPVTGVSSPAGTPLEPFQLIRCQDGFNAPLGDPNLCLNWPVPAAAQPSAVDDLWHAAVNGRGQYFSAADPDAVLTGLQQALLAINAQAGSGTGATTSTQDPIPGNDLTFRAGFRTVEWTGDIRAQQLYTGTDLSLEGTTLAGIVWSAQDKLDGQVGSLCDNRTIHLLRMGATNNLTPFTWNSRACDGFGAPTGSASTGLDASEQAYLGSAGPTYAATFPMNSWSQFLDMSDGTSASVDQRALAQGANLVNFLRGQRGMEDFLQGSSTKLFRKRIHVLGDIVGSQPRFVRPPNAQFTDLGYALFKAKSGIVDRPTMLYAGANDGMLHAFNVGSSVSDPNGGKELWAMVPSAVLPNLYRLGDAGYAESHTYFVDSTASTGDVYDKHKIVPDTCGGATDPLVARDCWKTLLVGGLGAGGRGYYAMDVTNPAIPKALWEFKWSDTCYDVSNPATHSADCHLGLTLGAPLITKLVDGTWVVLVSSGMNNINSPVKAGDGQGYLYVLDAITGKILQKIGTGVGSAASSTASLSGTLTLNGSTAVSGSGTAFSSELVQGQTIIVNGQSRVVQTIGDDTSLTVSMAFSGSGPFTGTSVTGTGPADFAYINAYVENYIQNNTAERVYGGDRLGNVWRIDLMRLTDPDDPTSAEVHYDVVKLATLLDPSGNPQPVSTTPQMMNIGLAKTRMVYVATGRYLGESDLSDTQVQTIYGLGENLTLRSDSAGYISNGHTVLPTTPLTLRQQLNQVVLSTVSGDPYTRQAASPVCSAAAGAAGIGCVGWYVDLPTAGERVNLDMRLVLGSLIVPSNVTNLSACDTGGNSWLNVFDAATGGEVPGSPYKAGKYMPGAVTVGISLIRTQSGRIMSILTKSDDTQQVSEVQTQQGAPQGRRSGWRDLLD